MTLMIDLEVGKIAKQKYCSNSQVGMSDVIEDSCTIDIIVYKISCVGKVKIVSTKQKWIKLLSGRSVFNRLKWWMRAENRKLNNDDLFT
jgi:hypothetical protein